MAYLGSTAASSVTNPPICLVPRLGGVTSTQLSTAVGSNVYREQGGALWLYRSSHGSTETMASNFFTDAWYLGMRPGDVILGYQWTTLGSSIVTYLGVLAAVSTAGAALSTGGTFTSTFS
jgi:hypothetical protein